MALRRARAERDPLKDFLIDGRDVPEVIAYDRWGARLNMMRRFTARRPW